MVKKTLPECEDALFDTLMGLRKLITLWEAWRHFDVAEQDKAEKERVKEFIIHYIGINIHATLDDWNQFCTLSNMKVRKKGLKVVQ